MNNTLKIMRYASIILCDKIIFMTSSLIILIYATNGETASILKTHVFKEANYE